VRSTRRAGSLQQGFDTFCSLDPELESAFLKFSPGLALGDTESMIVKLRMACGVIVLLAVCVAAATATRVNAEQPAGGAVEKETLGFSKEKPTEGPFVQVDGGYMVPYTQRIPGTDVSFEMVPVPGGTFQMGSPETEADRRDDEGPQVEIQVKPMWVAKEEVSWAEYKQFMNLYSVFKEFEARQIRKVDDKNRYDAITAPTELYDPSFTFEYGEEDDQPAVTMTQYAARQYTKWISRVCGVQYRLPGEAEWEYACRAGTQSAYSWGDLADEIDEYAWYIDNAYEGPVAGGEKKPNAFGLYDMHGDVAEWTVDRYSEDGYAALADKPGLTAESAVQWPEKAYPAVARGGSWEMEASDLRSAARLPSDDVSWKEEDPNYPRSPWWFTSDPSRGVGFRLFRSYNELPAEAIAKYWEVNTEDVQRDVQSRLSGGRGVLGLVDEELPAAIESMEDE
jgi:formylglycine-generating enzyme required for sulfatase activity